MSHLRHTSIAQPAQPGGPDPGETSVSAAFTCTDCRVTYEPTAEDFDAGRTGCPDPDCGGWTFRAELVEPAAEPTSRKTG